MVDESNRNEESIPFYPDHIRTELRVVAGLLVLTMVVGLLGMIFPVGLGDPADPMDTPEHIKPEWYFLALYQLLKFIPKTAGVAIPIAAVGLLTIWPFLDRKPEKSGKARRTRFIGVAVVVLILIAGTIWGELS
jgi:quinol-cytochrome oxidoreductase complex cytochrome b subunit